MTLEVQSTVPAGWYPDPGQTGGKRWWDGHQWTDNLQMPAAAATTSTVGPNPYGLNGGPGSGYTPLGHTGPINTSLAESNLPKSNGTAWLALIFGAAAVGLIFEPGLPGSPTYYVVAVGIIAILAAVRALLLRREKRSSNAWAPILGMLMGGGATVFVLFGAAIIGLLGSVSGGMITASANAPATVITTSPSTSPEPFVFGQNSQLTQGGTVVQTIATALNRTYAGGGSTLSAGQAWPTSLVVNGSAVVGPTGAGLATLPTGFAVKYVLSDDGKSYRVVATGSNTSELAIYSSATNSFTWSCLALDSTCVPAKN